MPASSAPTFTTGSTWSASTCRRCAHDWPGNVRELKNVAERWALGLPDALGDAGAAAGPGQSLAAQVDAAETRIIEDALRACGGQVAKAADLLAVPKKTLYDKLTRLGIVAERFR